jgi:hypothetical protein
MFPLRLQLVRGGAEDGSPLIEEDAESISQKLATKWTIDALA